MKKSKSNLAKCPCCSTERHRTEMEICLSTLEKIEKRDFKHYKEFGMDTYGSFIDANFEWACDTCLKSKKAIVANPGLQEYPWTPHLAYFDTQLKCFTCRTDYLFKKEEKKVWYESYKLPVSSQPNNCLDCRRKIRQQKAENKTVSEILKKPDSDITEAELKIVVDVFTSWDKMDKAKYYQSVLTKRQKKERNTTANNH